MDVLRSLGFSRGRRQSSHNAATARPRELSEWTKSDDKLMHTVKRGSVEGVMSIIGKKMRVDATKLDPDRGTTALHLAVSKGFTNIVDVLLRQPTTDIDVRDVHGRTPLHTAVRNAQLEVTQELLKHGADVNIIDHDCYSVLHHAVFGGHIGCVQLLLSADAPIYLKDKLGRTVLLHATWKGQASICRLLLDNGANVDECDRERRTGLMIAAEKGNTAVCDYLLRRGADVTLVDAQGHDAMWHSRMNGHPEVTKLLEQACCMRFHELCIDTNRELQTQVENHYEPVEDFDNDRRPKKPPRQRLASHTSSPDNNTCTSTVSVHREVFRIDRRSEQSDRGTAAEREPAPRHRKVDIHVVTFKDDEHDENDGDGVESERENTAVDGISERLETGEQSGRNDSRSEGKVSEVVQSHKEGIVHEESRTFGNTIDSVDLEQRRRRVKNEDGIDYYSGSQLEVRKCEDFGSDVMRLRQRIYELDNEKSALHQELNDLLEQMASLEMSRRKLETRCARSEHGQCALLIEVQNVRRQLQSTCQHLAGIEENDNVDAVRSVAAARSQLEELCSQVTILAKGKTALETTIDGNSGNDNRNNYGTNGFHGPGFTPSETELRMENEYLRARLEEAIAENHDLRADMENVEQLIQVARELKSENEALLVDYHNFRRRMSREDSEDSGSVKSSSSGEKSDTKVKERLDSGSEPDNGRKQIDGVKTHHTTELMNSTCDLKTTQSTAENRFGRPVDKESSDTENSSSEKEPDRDAKITYKEMCEEIETKTSIMPRNLIGNAGLQHEFDRMTEENEEMVNTVKELKQQLNQKCCEVAALRRKVRFLEEQQILQIEEVSDSLRSIMRKNDAERERRAADEESVASVSGSWRRREETPVLWKIGSDSSGSEKYVGSLSLVTEVGLSQVQSSVSMRDADAITSLDEISHSTPHSQSDSSSENKERIKLKERLVKDFDACWREISDESLVKSSPRMMDGSPDHSESCILLPKHYVEDLLEEIAALKEAVEQQTLHLKDAGSSSPDAAAFSSNENVQPQKSGSETSKTFSSRSNIAVFDSKDEKIKSSKSQGKTKVVEHLAISNKPDLIQHGLDENELDSGSLQKKNKTSADNFHTKSEKDRNCKEVVAIGYKERTSAGMPHDTNDDASVLVRKDGPFQASFGETKVLFLHGVVLNAEPAPLKRAWSDSDLRPAPFASTSMEKHSDPEQLGKLDCSYNEPFGLLETVLAGSKKLLLPTNGSEVEEAGEKLQETGRSDVDSEAQIVRKYNALLQSLRKTCSQANVNPNSEDVHIEECISVDELLILINTHEQLLADKNVLEEENRLLGVEIDQLVIRLWKAEGKMEDGALAAIAEEGLREELAEMENRLESKEAELERLKRLFQESGSLLYDEVDSFVDESFQRSNISRQHSQENEACNILLKQGNESALMENGKRSLSAKDKITQTDVDLLSTENDRLRAELHQMETDFQDLECSCRKQVENLKAEARQLQEEIAKLKQQQPTRLDDPDSMFCLQERLAGEIEQLSRELSTREAELDNCKETCRKLEEICRELEKCNSELRNQVTENVEDVERRKQALEDTGSAFDGEVCKQLTQKIGQLQVTNNCLVEQNVRLSANLELEQERNSRMIGNGCSMNRDSKSSVTKVDGCSATRSCNASEAASNDQKWKAVEEKSPTKIGRNQNIVSKSQKELSRRHDSQSGQIKMKSALDLWCDNTGTISITDDVSEISKEQFEMLQRNNAASVNGDLKVDHTGLVSSDLICQLRMQNAKLRCFISMLEHHGKKTSPSLPAEGRRDCATGGEQENVHRKDSFGLEEERTHLVVRLRQQLLENEKKYQEIIGNYRRHLLSAIQGRLDPNIKEALLTLVDLKQSDV